MFSIDEMVVRQKMDDIRKEVEQHRLQSRFRKNKKPGRSPFWIMLISLFRQH